MTFLWIITSLILISLGLIFIAVLKHSTHTSLILISLGLIFIAVLKHSTNTSSTDNEDDLAEWICPTCGFHVQLGIKCIYCGEKKTVVKERNWAN